MKPECECCGDDSYEGDFAICAYCERKLCPPCYPGSDVPCGLCEEDLIDYSEEDEER